MTQNHYTFSVDDALQQAFNRAAAQKHLDPAEVLRDFMRHYITRQNETAAPKEITIAEALGGYHPAAEIDIEFERDKSLPRIIEFD
ncbi:toxin-antitoxin system antitoxin subunit [Cardiobacterium hominis]|uniref:toxin-antitoxin system antitoxin subunit n=1 Tax=Cardiobacterium hominis TaxID=2718 RepID=UPI0028EFB0DF|nr:toxin-antitoxin system antitoxin subunit [Cardiobacterium hominis]